MDRTSAEHDRPSATVVDLDASETHGLRRSVLRDHLANRDVDYHTDHQPGSFHLGVRDPSGAVIAVATFNFEPAPGHPLGRAARLRGMAVEPRYQGEGLGTLILREALQRLQREEVELCWANARMSALGFYLRLGFEAVGEEFDSVGLPHRVVVRRLHNTGMLGS